MGIKFDSQRVRGTLRMIARTNPHAIDMALLEFGEQEGKESDKRVPVRYGDLKESKEVYVERRGAFSMVVIKYGNAEVDYAVYVHEDLEAFHATGQAKYLESVLVESRPYAAARLAKLLHFDRRRV